MRQRGKLAAALAAAACLAGACGGAEAEVAGLPSVIVHLTASSNEPQPGSTPALEELVRAAIRSDEGELVLQVGIGAQPAMRVTEDLVLRHGTAVENDPGRRQRLTEQKLETVRGHLMSAAGTAGHIDLLSALVEIGRTPGPAAVLVISSGLQTAAPLDLRAIGWDFDPARVVAQLAPHLPDLSGKEVTFAGLGDTAGTSQQPVPEVLRRKLVELWTTVCHESGAVRCEVADQPLAGGPPRSTVPVPPVQIPTIDPPHRPEGVKPTESTLPTALLFLPDSAELVPQYEQVLEPLAALLRPGDVTVELVGHTATFGPAEGARRLSVERAQAVADALVSLGVPADAITGVAGVGFDRPIVDDLDASGRLIPEVAARNRVVVATLTTRD